MDLPGRDEDDEDDDDADDDADDDDDDDCLLDTMFLSWHPRGSKCCATLFQNILIHNPSFPSASKFSTLGWFQVTVS